MRDMKDAEAWFNEAMHRIEMSWHADYHSESIGDLEAAVAALDKALAMQPDPLCRSDRVVLGSAPEIYELKCENCGHSEIFDIMSPEWESDSHWFE